MEIKLKTYQEEIVERIVKGRNFLLAMEMGTGKTVVSIRILKNIIETNQNPKILIVCPVALIGSVWKKELEKYDVRPGTGFDSSIEKVVQGQTPVCLTNYEKIRGNPLFASIQWDLIILDESHKIKNHKSKLAKSISKIYAKKKIALSGIPLQNSPFDIYSIGNFLYPNFFNYQIFKKEYCIIEPKVFGGKHFDQIVGYKNLDKLRERITPFTVFLSKTDVDEFEAMENVDYSNVLIEMGPQGEKLYEKILDDIKKKRWYDKTVIRLITALRLISSHPSLLRDSYEEYFNVNIPSPKLDTLVNMILIAKQEQSDVKIVVFSVFTKVMDLIAYKLKEFEVGFVQFRGDYDKKLNDKNLLEFQNSEKTVLLASDAGAYGLNITNATIIFNYDFPYNPAVYAQRVARLHRLGQTKKVFCYNLIMNNKIEERVVQLLLQKSKLFEDVVAEKDKTNVEIFRDLYNSIKEV